MKYDLSTVPKPRRRGFTQWGNGSVVIIIVVVFLSLVTVGMIGSMSKINAGKVDAMHKDAATQLANGIIEKARSAKWSEVGFVAGAPAQVGTEAYCTTDIKLNGSGGVRAKDSSGQDTVYNQGGGNAAIVPSSSEVVRGQTYCIRTDVTWKEKPEPVGGVLQSGGYGTKTVTATVRWYDPRSNGVVDEVRVESDRSPTIGEAVPSGISQGTTYSNPPAISTDFSPLEATNTYIRWNIGFKHTKKVVVQYSATASFTTPITVHTVDLPDPNQQNQTAMSWTYTTGVDAQKKGYFRTVLTGIDNSQTISTPILQGIAPTLSVVTPDEQASWPNSWIPTTVTNKLERATGDAGSFTPLAQTQSQSVAIPGVPDGIYRYRLVEESASTGWKIAAYSNIVRRDLRRVIPDPVLACYQNNYRGDVTVDWQDFNSTWSVDGSGSIKITEKGTSTAAVSATTAKASEYIFTPSTPASTFTDFDFFGDADRTGMGTALPANKTYTVEYTIAEPWGTKVVSKDCVVSPDLTAEVQSSAIPALTMKNLDQKTSFGFDSRHLGLGIAGSSSSKAAGGSLGTVKTELYSYTGSGPAGTLITTVNNTLPSYATTSGKFNTPDIQNPVNGGKYYFKLTINPGASAGPVRTIIVPYMFGTRDFTYNTNVAPRMFPVIEGDQISFYNIGAEGQPTNYLTGGGVGWSPCRSMAADVSATRIYCIFAGEVYRYDVLPAGNLTNKTLVGTGGWQIFRDITFVQNYFGDGKPALLGVIGRSDSTDANWSEGNILAYKIDDNGAPNSPVVVGRGFQNLMFQAVYDYSKPGDIGLYIAGFGDEHKPRIYPIKNGVLAPPSPVNWNVEVPENLKSVPSGWVLGGLSIAGMVHNANNEPVLNFDMKEMNNLNQGGSYTQVKLVAPADTQTNVAKMVPVNPGQVVSPRRPGSPGNEIFFGPNGVRDPKVGNLPGMGDGTTVGRIMTTANRGSSWVRTPASGGWVELTGNPFTDAGARGVKTDMTGQMWGKLSDFGELQVYQEGQPWRTFRGITDFEITGNTLMMVSDTGVLTATTGVANAASVTVATGVSKVSLSGERYGYLKTNGDYYVGSVRNAMSNFAGGKQEVFQGAGYSKIQVAGSYITGVLAASPTNIQYRTSQWDVWQTITDNAPVAILAMSQERVGYVDWNGTANLAEWSSPSTEYTSAVISGIDQMAINSMDQSDNHWAIGSNYGIWYKYGNLAGQPWVRFTSGEGFRHVSVEDTDNGLGMAGSLDSVQKSGDVSATVYQAKVTGWAYDREAPKQTVWVGFKVTYSNGTVATIAPQPADDFRTDVGSTFPVAGSYHAYNYTINLMAVHGAANIEAQLYRAGAGAYTQAPVVIGNMMVSSSKLSFQSVANLGRCIDALGAQANNRDQIVTWDCIMYSGQNWRWQDGMLQLENKGYIRCLDIENGNPAVGTLTHLWDCHGQPASQKFNYDPATKSLRNPVSGLCLDVPNADAFQGARLQMYTCNGSPAQQFNILKRG